MKKHIGFFLISISILFFCANIFAQDKSLLETLLKKGILSNEEASLIAKESVAVVFDKENASSLKLNFRVQTQYQNVDTSIDDNASSYSLLGTNGFEIRRIKLGAVADLGADWSADILLEFTRSSDSQRYLDRVYIRKKVDISFLNGNLDFGFRRVNFGYEENTSSAKLLSIERSMTTGYWSGSNNANRIGMGGRYAGIFWNGNIKEIEGLGYGFAITNSYNNNPTQIIDSADNCLNFFANVVYAKKFENFSFKTGLNFGYANDGNVISSQNRHTQIIGLNPYVAASFYKFNMWGEFLYSNIEDGKNSFQESANPFGLNFGIERRFDIGEYGEIAPAFIYSWLNTDGRGVAITGTAPAGYSMPEPYYGAQSFYFGLNWYIVGDSIKLQAGYEWSQFNGKRNDRHASVYATSSAFRIQFQTDF